MTQLVVSEIVRSCKENGGYKTPELNNILYLNYLGISSLCEMPKYEPVCMWLQGNRLSVLKYLMPSIRCLYLQSNAICDIQGLNELVNLKELNLSNNMIQVVSLGLPENLENLYLSKNLITDSKNLVSLCELKHLNHLDISDNQIKDEFLVNVLMNTNLHVVQTEGNPFHKKIAYFRKEMIQNLKGLVYLDSRPVESAERRMAQAFYAGGRPAELQERLKIQQEKEVRNRESYKSVSYLFSFRSTSSRFSRSGRFSKLEH